MEKLSTYIVKSKEGFEMRCPKCDNIIFIAPTERAIGWQSEKVEKHICPSDTSGD
jgi:uncharacterized C2H2 Zn-finger protein